jgi:type VI secretion system VasD/TssJ family lipoprotein
MGVKCFGFEGLLGAAVPALALSAMALLLSYGCGHAATPAPETPPPPPCATPEPLRVSLQASQHLNPGERGEALATVIRLYQLKGSAKIASASFDDLLDHDRDALGEDFLGVQEVTINPGDKSDPPLLRNADATTLGAVALFRQPAGTTWRAILKLAPPDPQHCHAPPRPTDPAKANKVPDNTIRIFLDENRLELR